MIFRDSIIAFLFASSIQTSIGASNSSTCNQSCLGNRVDYPFGFSVGCKIQLNCRSDGQILLAGFKVNNVTSDSIMIFFPGTCNRPIEEIKKLFDQHYAPTWQNGLLLQNCTSSSSSCVVPASYLESSVKLQDCKNRNLSCHAVTNSGIDVLSYENISRTGCKFLFSSLFVEWSVKWNSSLSLDFETLQLGWWLTGKCHCSENANCTTVHLPDGSPGYRCRCDDGFTGDGFADGQGCRKVSGHRGGTRIAVLIGGIAAGTSCVAVALAVIFLFSRRRSRSPSSESQMSARRPLCEAAGSSSVHMYTYNEIDKATNGFSEKQRLGTGAYGTVYVGRVQNVYPIRVQIDECVAIKKIKHRDNESTEQVMNEIKLVSSVSHPNLVRLLGCCIENGEQILVYEYMPNGTLAQHLQKQKGRALPWTVRLKIATETAQAITYLHSAMNPPIYHWDIKSSNILLDFEYRSKLADFGLSRLVMTELSHISTAPQGTLGYVDPEYHQNFHLSDKSDVYSFGVVLLEIITALKVVDFSRPQKEVNLAALAVDRFGKGRINEIIDPFLGSNRDAWTLSSIHKVAELAFRCLAYHTDMRPSMMEVADELQHIKLSGWAPLEENICIASSSSPFNGSEKSLASVIAVKKAARRRLLVPQQTEDCWLASTTEEVKDSSPVSVQGTWQSEQRSPSTNSLLGHVFQ
ncbi:hypothetical protein Nepgr_008284 [Nepenthes gracilis]|uniref:Protein kinase domain-containing protein n=1 Tax=Nepenthes gracilis TaxID=150966 RepID=A0AAD3S8T7_NEPGR|nr:hypothetical protein Nepgr_008284 [Nepenthes gracilis]